MGDVIVTGLPRSGSTLVCELLNLAHDTVALDEPMDVGPWAGRPAQTRGGRLTNIIRSRRRRDWPAIADFDPAKTTELIARFFADTRASLLADGTAISKTVDGAVRGKKFSEATGQGGVRELVGKVVTMRVDKPLSDDFTLAVKHNARFSGMLSHLVGRFTAFAIIRNPLAMLTSWQTVDLPIQRGRPSGAGRMDAALRSKLDDVADVLERQLIILDWFFATFDANLPATSILRYEDIVASGGRTLAVVTPHAATIDAQLQDRNLASVYDRDVMRRLGEHLLRSPGAWARFYAPDDVRRLMETAG